MRLLKLIILSSIALSFAVLGILLVINNPQDLALNLLVWQLPAFNVVFWLLGFFVLGAIAGYGYCRVRVLLQPKK